MRQLTNIIKLMTVLAGFAAYEARGASVEAKKDGVKVLDAPSNSGKEIATLNKGESAESEDRQGMYWSVKVGGKAGFVSVMQVNRKQGEPSSLSNAIKSAVKQGRSDDDPASARGRSAVMGVRGLDDSDDTAFAGNVKPNLRMVFQLEDLQMPQQRIEALGEQVFAEIDKKTK
jgi:hypothetical protein